MLLVLLVLLHLVQIWVDLLNIPLRELMVGKHDGTEAGKAEGTHDPLLRRAEEVRVLYEGEDVDSQTAGHDELAWGGAAAEHGPHGGEEHGDGFGEIDDERKEGEEDDGNGGEDVVSAGRVGTD
ncbi:hypothetical protein DPSP01_013024 [Paraphaeosphaeria sporulosa]